MAPPGARGGRRAGHRGRRRPGAARPGGGARGTRRGEIRPIRLTLARYLSLALEFQLAADILSTAISPSWDEIGKLSAIAVIRTGLNYFLGLEVKGESVAATALAGGPSREQAPPPAAP